jgi:hypothetical protein
MPCALCPVGGWLRNLLCYSGRVSAEGRTTHAPASPGDLRQRSPLLSNEHLAPVAITVVAGAGVLLFFLAVYGVKHYPMPIGYDTPRYLFQTNLVAQFGLAHVPRVLPPPTRSLATRTGFPVVILTLSGLFSVSTFKLAATVPAAAATAVALAAGVFVSWGFRRGPWELAAVTAVVGTSVILVRLFAPETYTDNLLATAVLLAALVPILSALRDGPGVVCAVLLLGLGGVIHPQFFALFAVILGLTALLYLPPSWRAWRRHQVDLVRTPAARLGIVVGGASAITAAGFLLALRGWPVGPRQTRFELAKKLREDLPLYRFPLTIPVAAVGGVTLGALGFGRSHGSVDGGLPSTPGTRERFAARFLLALSVAWGVVTVAGLVAYHLGTGTAAHRLLSFLIPLPILMAIGIVGLARALASRTRAVAGVAVVLLGIGAVTFLGYRDLYVNLPRDRGIEFLDVGKVRDAAAAEEYLERARVVEDAPIVFVVDDRGPNPLSFVPEMAYMIRSVLPAERILHAYLYVGDPQSYLAGRPTYRDSPRTYNANVRRFWPSVQRLLPRHPVALLLASYNQAYRGFVESHPGTVVAPNVALLSGPTIPALMGRPSFPTGPRGVFQGGLLGVGTLLVLALIGAGWAVAGLPRTLRPFEILALSPALGIAALVAGGILVDAVGFRLRGLAAGITPVVVAVAGGVLAWVCRRQRPAGASGGTGTI